MRINAERFLACLQELDTGSSGTGFSAGHTMPQRAEMNLHEWCHLAAARVSTRRNPERVSSLVSRMCFDMAYELRWHNEIETLAIQAIIMEAAGWFRIGGRARWLRQIADDQKHLELPRLVRLRMHDHGIQALARKTVRQLQQRAYRRRKKNVDRIFHGSTGQDQSGDTGGAPGPGQ